MGSLKCVDVRGFCDNTRAIETNNAQEGKTMNKKTATIIAALNSERDALNARMAELDDVFCAGNGSAELETEFYAADRRVRELGGLIHQAGQPKRKICPNTQALVSANID